MPVDQSDLQKVSVKLAVGIISLLLLLVIFVLHQTELPSPIEATASPTVFSSARAMAYLRHIAQKPHAIGTPENAEVRDYLVGELKALGFEPEIESGTGKVSFPQYGAIGRVHNILVRIPGQVPGKALMLSAHYDSVPTSSGAADDGASVAAILETLRVLKTSMPLKNDVICLFTDGEEAGMLGSDLFVSEHRWAKDVGLVLNFEFRGNDGPMLMFETSVGNGKLISGFAKSAPHPVSNSLLYEVYKMLPNGSDLSAFKKAGMPGLNFAAIERPTSYHMQLDRPELLNESTLQHEGETMVPLVQYFGNIPLNNIKSDDSIYFEFPGLGLVSYAANWAIPLCFLAVVSFLVVLVVGVKGGSVRLGRTMVGAATFLPMIILLAGVCQLLWIAIGMTHPEYLMFADPYNSKWYLMAFVTLVIGFFVLMQSGLKRWIKAMELGLGAMLCWLLLLVVASVLMPGASFLLLWSLLPSLLALGILFSTWGKNTSIGAKVWILVFGLTPGVILFAPLTRNLFIGFSPQLSFVAGLAVALLMGLAAPLLAFLTRRFVLPLLPLLAGAAFLVAGSVTANVDVDHPSTVNLFYALDGVSGKAFWISRDNELNSWSKTFFPAGSVRHAVPEIFGTSPRVYWSGPAPVLPGLQAPVIDVLRDSTNGTVRDVAIRVKSSRGAPSFLVRVDGAEVLNSHIQGKLFTTQPTSKWTFETFGFSDDWVDIALQIEPGKTFQIRVSDETYGLPKIDLHPRPTYMIPTIFGTNGDTIRVVQSKIFN